MSTPTTTPSLVDEGAFAKQLMKTILDDAPVWEQALPSGPTMTVTVSDAAHTIAHTVRDYLQSMDEDKYSAGFINGMRACYTMAEHAKVTAADLSAVAGLTIHQTVLKNAVDTVREHGIESE